MFYLNTNRTILGLIYHILILPNLKTIRIKKNTVAEKIHVARTMDFLQFWKTIQFWTNLTDLKGKTVQIDEDIFWSINTKIECINRQTVQQMTFRVRLIQKMIKMQVYRMKSLFHFYKKIRAIVMLQRSGSAWKFFKIMVKKVLRRSNVEF